MGGALIVHAELEEHATGVSGVYEGDLLAVCAVQGSVAQQAKSVLLGDSARLVDVVGGQGDVMDALAPAFEKASDGAVFAGGFEQLEHRLSAAEEGDLDALLLDFIEEFEGEPEDIPVQGDRCGEGTNRDPDVIDMLERHHGKLHFAQGGAARPGGHARTAYRCPGGRARGAQPFPSDATSFIIPHGGPDAGRAFLSANTPAIMATTKRPTAGFDDPFFRKSEEASEIHELGEDELELVEEPGASAPNPFGESVLEDDDGEWVDEKTRVWQGGNDPAPAPAPAPAPVAPAPAPAARPASVRISSSAGHRAAAPPPDPMEEERTVITDSSLVGGRVEHQGPARRMTAGSGPVIPVPAAPAEKESNSTTRLLAALLLVALVALVAALVFVFGTSSTTAVDESVTLAIFSEPTGATVLVDGVPYVPEGAANPATTPTTVRGFAANTDVQIRLQRDGFQDLERTVRLAPGERATERYQLQPRTATLIVSTNPAGASVRINDVERGSAPLTVDDLQPGQRYRVVASRDGYEAAERTVDFTDSAQLEQRVALTLIPEVEDELEEVEPTPPPVAERAPAPRTAEPRREATRSAPTPRESTTREAPATRTAEPTTTERPRAVRERPSAIAQGSAAPAPSGRGSVSVNARPYGQVWINGRMVASETPLLNHELSAGSHEVRVFFVEAGEFSEIRRVQVEPGQNQRVVFTRR